MIRRMTQGDIPAAMRLKETAGWNQTEQDWRNLLAIEPEGCWLYEAGQPPPGTVAGSTTIVCYGRALAWIGMVLVLPEFRRQGIARQLMEHALRFAEDRGVQRVALDATAAGQPLYRRLGFEDETPIERWEGIAPATSGNADGEGLRPGAGTHLEQMANLDRLACGVDRRILIERLVNTAPEDCWFSRGGYLLARPGSNARFLGPCVAEEPEAARRLLRALFARYPGHPFYWDLLPENRAAVELAVDLGFQRARSLTRMSRPAVSGGAARPRSSWQFATAGFEYG